MIDDSAHTTDREEMLLREVAGEIGQALEGGLDVAIRQAHGVLSLVVQRMTDDAAGGSPEKAVLEQMNRVLGAVSSASHVVPKVAGEATKTFSLLSMSTGLKLLRAFNKEINVLR